ncbi:DUF1800 domain-containing protein [Mariniradius sediminis]|uniref:DUF1800 domain-containing protein n=1 Tax=Mariniradius sediminis TaxID=2909237 RepID=A0ABS9C0J1_9BACT|nr:DUF1800 family protein [Mariniradius sediminis]MCF1752961.1 DUF1800 domain-containing protein [Mariniradius sediminis]
MEPIRCGQYRHLAAKYRKVAPPDFEVIRQQFDANTDYSNARLQFVTTGLEPFSGQLTDRHIAHLLKRTLFGMKMEDIRRHRGRSIDAILNEILVVNQNIGTPINNYNDAGEGVIDPVVPLGASFVEAPFHQDIEGERIISMKTWLLGRILSSTPTIQEKMLLFWWNFLPIKLWDVFVAKSGYRYIKMLYRNSLGNFKTLIKELTMDPAMLVFLSGAFNNKDTPDENYAREIQELFCIGKGPGAGYQESDVQATARVLTGWTVDWNSIHRAGEPVSYFNPEMHHTGNKQFSAFYGNRLITGKTGAAGAGELDELLDMIFGTEECAKHISRKLYAFFVATEISENAEANVIAPMANLIRQNNYNILPALRALLSSAHFFHPEVMGAMIKTPIDHTIGLWRTFEMPRAASASAERSFYSSMLWQMSGIGLEIGDPPNVAGWTPYYQVPMYDKLWINTDSITKRALSSDSMVYWGFWIGNGVEIPADLIEYVKTFDTPEDPNALVRQVALLNMGIELTDTQVDFIKKILLNGQDQDYYWTGAWLTFMAEPGNQEKKNIVVNRLKPAFQVMLQLAEAQLM